MDKVAPQPEQDPAHAKLQKHVEGREVALRRQRGPKVCENRGAASASSMQARHR